MGNVNGPLILQIYGGLAVVYMPSSKDKHMNKFNTFVQLKELMFAMEQDLGISELSEPEKCVFSCIVQASEAGELISTKSIEQHILTSNMSRPTLFRCIRQLLAKGIISQPSHGKYLVAASS